jgi:hypothetical protein
VAKKIIQTDIAIQNPSNQTITFPATSGITIGINEIMPGAPGWWRNRSYIIVKVYCKSKNLFFFYFIFLADLYDKNSIIALHIKLDELIFYQLCYYLLFIIWNPDLIGGWSLLTISILRLLVIAIVAGFGLLVMSLEANSAFGQWIVSSELEEAYKQGHLESNVTMDEGGIRQKW